MPFCRNPLCDARVKHRGDYCQECAPERDDRPARNYAPPAQPPIVPAFPDWLTPMGIDETVADVQRRSRQ